MKKTPPKKLAVSTQTLRNLSDAELVRTTGGAGPCLPSRVGVCGLTTTNNAVSK